MAKLRFLREFPWFVEKCPANPAPQKCLMRKRLTIKTPLIIDEAEYNFG